MVEIFLSVGNLKNGVKDIKEHDWFKGIDYIALLRQELPPPYQPKVRGPSDCSNFDEIDDDFYVKNAPYCQYEREFSDF